jgi:hypothetical protein
MKLLITTAVLSALLTTTVSAQTNAFISGQVGTIRQATDASNQVRVNLIGANTDASTCQTRNFAVVLENDSANFKNIYAAVLTARALEATVQFAFDPSVCTVVNSFGASFAIANEVFLEN